MVARQGLNFQVYSMTHQSIDWNIQADEGRECSARLGRCLAAIRFPAHTGIACACVVRQVEQMRRSSPAQAIIKAAENRVGEVWARWAAELGRWAARHTAEEFVGNTFGRRGNVIGVLLRARGRIDIDALRAQHSEFSCVFPSAGRVTRQSPQ